MTVKTKQILDVHVISMLATGQTKTTDNDSEFASSS